ncbi:MAG: protein kinase [Anaerolineae bacterium]|nr:protein kinase [Anaerolineae bacterium]
MTVIIGERFELNTEPEYILGSGGMGTVYLGVDTQTGQQVAIKQLLGSVVRDRPETLERFAREAEALRLLNHPNIVKVLATINNDPDHYIVMEYVPGGNLRDYLDEHGALPLRRTLEIALDVADALTRAHRLRITHRDLKPANILLAQDGTPRLTDFGVAHLADKPDVTRTGAVVGTVNYLSPEALNGLPFDTRTDVWAFGVMMYEMLVGQRPFEGDNVTARVTAILTHPVPDLTKLRHDVPPNVFGLIRQMLEKDPDRRINSVRRVGAEVENMLRNLDSATEVMEPPVLANPGQPAKPDSRFNTPTNMNIPAFALEPENAVGNVQNQSATRNITLDDISSTSNTDNERITAPQTSQEIVTTPQRRVPVWAWAVMAVLAMAVVGLGLVASGVLTPAETVEVDAAVLPAPSGDTLRVLIADIQPLSGASERDITRMIMNDLEQRYEIGNTHTKLDIVRYPESITSQDDAVTIANREKAAVVVWGTYDNNRVQLDVQAGSVALFPTIHFPRGIIDRIANVRLELQDPQTESIAPYVAGVVGILHSADGNLAEWARMIAIIPTDVTSPTVVRSSAANTHCYFQQYLASPDTATSCIDSAISAEPGNAILYWLRAMARNRDYLIEFVDERMLPAQLNTLRDAAAQDFETAKRLGPDNWVMPLFSHLDGSTVGNRKSNLVIVNDVNEIETAVSLRSDDWTPLYIRAELAYKQGDIDLAREYIDRALESEPDVTLPYTSALLLALRQGDLAAVHDYIETIVMDFPDYTVSARMFDVLIGVTIPESLIPGIFSNLVIGQYSAASNIAQAFNQGNSSPGLFGGDETLILLTGISQCGQGNYEQANLAFTNVINFDRTFAFARLMRASAAREVGDRSRFDSDLESLRNSSQADILAPYIDAVNTGELTCANVFDLNVLGRYHPDEVVPDA